jgi:hypothetical protein
MIEIKLRELRTNCSKFLEQFEGVIRLWIMITKAIVHPPKCHKFLNSQKQNN